MTVERVEVVVLGAGPAGLAAAAALVRQSPLNIRVLEYGAPVAERDRYEPADVTSGVGGAGLFSDGKFSFFPSATYLWRLSPRDELEEAYSWYRALLSDLPWVDLVPELPGLHGQPRERPVGGHIVEKAYPSFYTSLAERTVLTSELARSLGADVVRTNTDIDEVEVTQHGVSIVSSDRTSGRVTEFTARALVLATGRLGPLELLRLVPAAPWREGRLEVGVRLEQPADAFLLVDHPSVDPKLVAAQVNGGTARTFCCCRNGEVVTTDTRGVVSVSGRADVSPTGQSNVGIVLRPSDSTRANDPSLLDRIADTGQHLVCGLADFLQSDPSLDLIAVLSQPIAASLGDAIRDIADVLRCEISTEDSMVHGVAIEGVGTYPAIGADLRWGDLPVWVVGDATGLFRGLTAAFVSGFFAGSRARSFLAGT